jgi:glycerol-3-phosphate O-acyltransferase
MFCVSCRLPRRVSSVSESRVDGDASLIVLVDVSSETERRLVDDALARMASRPTTVLPLRG